MPIKKRVLLGVLFLILWVLFVLYPNPYKLFVSVMRLTDPPVDYAAKGMEDFIEATRKKNSVWIEDFVKDEIPYRHDWETSNLPWYFPTVEEVLEKRKGDCKSRMLILASILEFHGIHYEFLISPTHVWVSYERKVETRTEREEVALAVFSEERREIKMPEINRERFFRTFRRAFWDPMPPAKKRQLHGGLSASLLFIVFMPGKIEKRPLPPI